MPTVPEESYRKRIEKTLDTLRNNISIRWENKEMLFQYYKYMVMNGYSLSRTYKNILYLMQMAEHIRAPFTWAKREDIEDIVFWVVSRKDISEETKLDYKIVLKRFYRWIGNGEYPECVKWISTTRKKRNEKLPEELLTEDDVVRMISVASNARDRAFIAMLWETGARIGEIIDLRIKSFEDFPHGKKVVLRGKTGARKVSLIFSVPYLQAWIAAHPDRDNPEAPLWVNVGTKGNGKKVGYAALNHMLQKVAKKAGINKPVNPHHFRHSRATYLATEFTESQLCQWFGWVQGSRVPATYVHLSGRDLDRKYLSIYGIKIEDEGKSSRYTPEKCPRCGAFVEPDARFCHRCGMALDLETAVEAEKMEEKMVEIFLSSSNEELKKVFSVMKKLYEVYEEEKGRGALK